MITTIKTKEGKEEIHKTQEYLLGTYVIVNDNVSFQRVVSETELEYHKDLRKRVLKAGDEFSGTELW